MNTVGNCSSRVTAMIGKTFDGAMPADARGGDAWPATCACVVKQWEGHMDRFELGPAAAAAIGLLREVDGFINRTEPFKLAKDPAKRDEVASILAQCAETVRIASVLLEPFLPQRMADLQTALGAPMAGEPWARKVAWGGLKAGTSMSKVALYPRIEAPGTPA